MADTSDVERLKSVIIEHVAKDVLILTDNVEKLTEQLSQVGNMLKLLEQNTEKQFDVAAKQIMEFLVAQEKHLAEIADARTKQISLTVSDNVEKILHGKFDTYQKSVDSALEKFQSANVAAVQNLHKSYNEAEARINEAGRSPEKPGDGSTKKMLTIAVVALSATTTLAIVTGLFMFLK